MLVEPRYPGNIGACARALKNCGFTSLRLVRPPKLDGEARKMAWKSLDLLERSRHYDSVDSAIADARLVVAFSSRLRRDTRNVLTLDEAIPKILEAEQSGRVALMFGREDRGLTREEMLPCQFLVNIPAARVRQVYNLSQAVLLAAFSLRRAWLERPTGEPPAPDKVRALTAGQKSHLKKRIRETLVALGYDQHADQGLLERIVTRSTRFLDRAGIDDSDQAMLLGILKRIEGRREQR